MILVYSMINVWLETQTAASSYHNNFVFLSYLFYAGMCCVYGEGYFSVYNGMYMVESSGVFGTETSLNFEVRQRRSINTISIGDSTSGSDNASSASRRSVSMRLSIYYDNFPMVRVLWFTFPVVVYGTAVLFYSYSILTQSDQNTNLT